MPMIELTEEQRQAVKSGEVVRVFAPEMGEDVVLLQAARYESLRNLQEQEKGRQQVETAPDIPPGILRSQEAFWQDLPQLLSQKKFRSRWVCYQGHERIGIGAHHELIRECLRRGIPDDEYYLARIRPRERPPWELEEVEPLGPHHLEDYPPET